MLPDPERRILSLDDIKARFEIDKTPDTPTAGLPVIDSSTYDLLIARYKIPDVQDGQPMTPRLQEALFSSYRVGLEIAASTMSFFKEEKKPKETTGMFFQTCQWLDGIYSPYLGIQLPPEFKDAATVGLTMVFKAFQIQLPSRNFLETLRSAPTTLLYSAFNTKGEPFAKKVAIVDRLRYSNENPKHQVFLDDFLERFKTFCVPNINFENAFLDGALKGYHVSEAVWNSLSSEPRKE